VIDRAFEQQKEVGPGLVHDENDFLTKTFTEFFETDTDIIRFDDQQARQQAETLLGRVYPGTHYQFELHRGKKSLFSEYGIEAEVQRLEQPEVPLPNGGMIIIEKARGLVAIDVQSGTVRPRQGFRAASLEINLAAAEEIPRQLRLRNLEGLIVVDFIDLEQDKDGKSVIDRLHTSIKRDRASFVILPISKLGLVEVARKRTGSIFVGRTDPVGRTSQVSEAEGAHPKVFLCYRREDTRNHAGRIHDWLTDHFGEDAVFYDLNIPVGEDWRLFIEQAIRRSSLMLVLIGESWLPAIQKGQNNADDFVRFEIEKAIERQLRIIPLSVGKAKFPSVRELPPSIEQLAFQRGLPIREEPDFRTDMRQLIDVLTSYGLINTKKTRKPKARAGNRSV
jgi:hypothetical protein